MDGVGHGRRVTSLHNNDYGSIGHSLGVMNAYAAFAGHISGDRSISTTSAESTDGVAIGGVVQQQRLQPVYDYYSRSGNYGTVRYFLNIILWLVPMKNLGLKGN